MIRDLKILGLALIAVFALSGVAASMASAQQGKLTTDGTSVTQVSTEDGTNFIAYPGLGAVECPGSTARSHKVATTPHEAIPTPATEATITPSFASCTSTGHQVTTTVNGCDFVFHIGNTTGVSDTYALTVDVICPAGKTIESHVYLSAPPNSNTVTCTFKIPEQKGVTGFTIANEIEGGKTNDTLTITGKSSGVKMTKEGLCGAGETSAAEQELNTTVIGTNAEGKATGITITDV